MRIVIRRMTADDIEGVLSVERACFSQPWSREAFSATLLLPYTYYYVAVATDDDTPDEDGLVNTVTRPATDMTEAAAGDEATGDEAAGDEAAGDEAAGCGCICKTIIRSRIIGECGVRDILGEGEITNVAVLPGYRGNGIATRMLGTLLEESAARGTRTFTLEVRAGNTAALALYKSFGFKTEGRRAAFYEDPIEDALIMWRHERGNYD